jgi:hypothetical protein
MKSTVFTLWAAMVAVGRQVSLAGSRLVALKLVVFDVV